MKAVITTIAAVCAITLTGCGKLTAAETTEKNSKTSATAAQSSAAETSTEPQTDSQPESTGNKKAAQSRVGENGAKAVSHVLLIPDEDIDISDKVQFSDMYGRHVLHTGVVGLVGAPVEVDFDEDISGRLVFVYEPDNLEGVRTDALIFLWYDESRDQYIEMEDVSFDYSMNAISIKINKPGTYMLVNKYSWLNAWGAELSDNGLEEGYDPLAQPLNSDPWESSEDTGDIMELVDYDYIAASKNSSDLADAFFKVSTPEQLASAVYYVNCATAGDIYNSRPQIDIELDSDIDLSGYEWSPMGWRGAGIDYGFTGVINGGGHTIKNMTIAGSPYGGGFIGYGSGCNVNDLHFENAKVDGFDSGVIIGEDYCSSLAGCTATGTVSGTNAGGLVGLGIRTVFDSKCSCDVEVNGEKQTKYLSGSDAGKAKAEEDNPPTETLSIGKDGLVHREAGIEGNYQNLCWHIERGGEEILERSADSETVLPENEIDMLTGGGYSVCLVAYVDGYYIPVSNTVEVPVRE